MNHIHRVQREVHCGFDQESRARLGEHFYTVPNLGSISAQGVAEELQAPNRLARRVDQCTSFLSSGLVDYDFGRLHLAIRRIAGDVVCGPHEPLWTLSRHGLG